jgi:uncharacterized protein (TIGR02246 family)
VDVMGDDEPTEDERAIRELVETWMEATRSGDVSTVLDLMTDDVVFVVPDREPFGKEAFEAMSAEMEGVEMDGTYDVEELEVLGDRAYLRNYIEMTMTPPDGEPVHQSGRTLTILRKGTDGRWRLARDANLVTPEE